MQPIFLIGYMGCGKSTLGRTVSALAGMRFIDLDDMIEDRWGMTIRDMFAAVGEDEFRRRESDMLREVAAMTDVIVACGGGTPCSPGNMEVMNAAGLTVLLSAPIKKLHSRLMRGRAKRPLIANLTDSELLEFIINGLSRRMPFYSRAAVTFDSGALDLEPDKIATAHRFISEVLPLSNISSEK